MSVKIEFVLFIFSQTNTDIKKVLSTCNNYTKNILKKQD